jgi:hypothetical protein
VTAIEPAPDELTAVVAAFRTAEEALAAVTANATRLASAAEQLVGARQTVAAGGTVLGDVATALQGRAAGLGAATGELAAAAAAVRAVDRRGVAAALAAMRRSQRLHTLLLIAVLLVAGCCCAADRGRRARRVPVPEAGRPSGRPGCGRVPSRCTTAGEGRHGRRICSGRAEVRRPVGRPDSRAAGARCLLTGGRRSPPGGPSTGRPAG